MKKLLPSKKVRLEYYLPAQLPVTLCYILDTGIVYFISAQQLFCIEEAGNLPFVVP
jgi:hypothetical protein